MAAFGSPPVFLFTFSRVISKTHDPLEDFPIMPFRSILRTPVIVGLLAAGPLQFASPLMVSAIASERHVHAQDAAMQMRRLFSDSDEASLRRNPLNALYRGDMRYAGQFGDLLSDAHIAAERAAAEDDLKQLALIDRARLSSTDQVIYDTFKWQRTLDLRSEESRVGNACVYV